jgi:uncharacterized protein (TIGR03086 family)
VARDVVRHMVEWMPGVVLSAAGIEVPTGPSVDDDPVGAWLVLSDTIQSALDDPITAAKDLETRAGPCTVESGIGMFYLPDVLVHTWDLARATGQDESLDTDEVHQIYVGMLPADEMLRSSGHYGARVHVPDDADEQTKLIAFTGRQP